MLLEQPLRVWEICRMVLTSDGEFVIFNETLSDQDVLVQKSLVLSHDAYPIRIFPNFHEPFSQLTTL